MEKLDSLFSTAAKYVYAFWADIRKLLPEQFLLFLRWRKWPEEASEAGSNSSIFEIISMASESIVIQEKGMKESNWYIFSRYDLLKVIDHEPSPDEKICMQKW